MNFSHEIDPKQNANQLRKEIESKDKFYFVFDFKELINGSMDSQKLSLEDFWKLAKIKAKKVSIFVDEILSCEVIQDAPLGFIREITMPGADVMQGHEPTVITIQERVVIDEDSKTILFFQLKSTGKMLLFAINQVLSEDNNLYFTGHYVFNIPKESADEKDREAMSNMKKLLPERVKLMIANMKKFATSDQFKKFYQKLYE